MFFSYITDNIDIGLLTEYVGLKKWAGGALGDERNKKDDVFFSYVKNKL